MTNLELALLLALTGGYFWIGVRVVMFGHARMGMALRQERMLHYLGVVCVWPALVLVALGRSIRDMVRSGR